MLIAQPRRSREPGCHSRLRLFSPAAALICSLLPAPPASSSLTTPPHKAIGERGLMPLYSFPSSCNLMLIKTSAQGLATYRHKDYTGIPTQPLSVNAARVKRIERRKKEIRCASPGTTLSDWTKILLWFYPRSFFFC